MYLPCMQTAAMMLTLIWMCDEQVIIEGPEESKEEAQARLVKCMEEPFVRDRKLLYEMSQIRKTNNSFDWEKDGAKWDSIYHNPLLVSLTVDADSAKTWYEAK